MHIGELCTVQTTYCKRDETVQAAALLMRALEGDLSAAMAPKESATATNEAIRRIKGVRLLRRQPPP